MPAREIKSYSLFLLVILANGLFLPPNICLPPPRFFLPTSSGENLSFTLLYFFNVSSTAFSNLLYLCNTNQIYPDSLKLILNCPCTNTVPFDTLSNSCEAYPYTGVLLC